MIDKEYEMKTLATRAVVNDPANPDGFYYREEHEWRNLDAEASAKFEAFMKESVALINRETKNSQGPLVATLSSVIDGAAQPDIVVKNVSLDDVTKFERHAHKFGDALIGMGEERAKKKGRGQHKRQ